MNTDVKDILKKFPVRDPAILGGVAFLVVGLVLFVLTAGSFIRSTAERRVLQDEYQTVSESLEQVLQVQQAGPVQLRSRLDGARGQLTELLAGFPSEQQATEELARYYDYAQQFNTQLMRLETTSSISGGTEELQTLYETERFAIEAEGAVPHLLQFLIQVTQEAYDTFVIDNVAVAPNSPAVMHADLTILYSAFTPEPKVEPDASPDATPPLATPAPLGQQLTASSTQRSSGARVSAP